MISTQVEVVAEAEKTDGRRKSMAVLKKERQYKRIMSRKISVYASAIRNPAALTASLASLWSAAATVAAALRITFARTLVLGVSVAATVQPALRRDFAPAVAATLKPMHRQWAPTIIDVCVRAVCVAIAWRLQRGISAFNSVWKSNFGRSTPSTRRCPRIFVNLDGVEVHEDPRIIT